MLVVASFPGSSGARLCSNFTMWPGNDARLVVMLATDFLIIILTITYIVSQESIL